MRSTSKLSMGSLSVTLPDALSRSSKRTVSLGIPPMIILRFSALTGSLPVADMCLLSYAVLLHA